jgi:hypothetical protein
VECRGRLKMLKKFWLKSLKRPQVMPRRGWVNYINILTRKQGWRVWTRSMASRIWSSGGILWRRQWTSEFHKIRGTSWLTKRTYRLPKNDAAPWNWLCSYLINGLVSNMNDSVKEVALERVICHIQFSFCPATSKMSPHENLVHGLWSNSNLSTLSGKTQTQ